MITVDQVKRLLHYEPYYANIEDAAAAYEKAAKELFGEFARSA